MSTRSPFVLAALTGLLGVTLMLSGCAHQRQLLAGDVSAIPVGQSVALPAEDMVRVLRLAGFSDKEVLDYGPKLRNSLAAGGGGRIVRDNKVLALFVLDENSLYVTSMLRGTFRYSLNEPPAAETAPQEPAVQNLPPIP